MDAREIEDWGVFLTQIFIFFLDVKETLILLVSSDCLLSGVRGVRVVSCKFEISD